MLGCCHKNEKNKVVSVRHNCSSSCSYKRVAGQLCSWHPWGFCHLGQFPLDIVIVCLVFIIERRWRKREFQARGTVSGKALGWKVWRWANNLALWCVGWSSGWKGRALTTMKISLGRILYRKRVKTLEQGVTASQLHSDAASAVVWWIQKQQPRRL